MPINNNLQIETQFNNYLDIDKDFNLISLLQISEIILNNQIISVLNND